MAAILGSRYRSFSCPYAHYGYVCPVFNNQYYRRATAISTGAQHWQVYLEHDTNTEGVGVRSYTEIAPEFVERSDADDDVEDVEEAVEVTVDTAVDIFEAFAIGKRSTSEHLIQKRNLITLLIWLFTSNHDEPPP
jgi:hypothetical protein